jgi:hypothetical protein
MRHLIVIGSLLLVACTADTFTSDDGGGGDSGNPNKDVVDPPDGDPSEASTGDADASTGDGATTIDAPIDTKPPAARIVFVTSGTFDADLGGASGADSKCQSAASAASLPGTYYAWVSTSTSSPSSHFVKSGTEWRRRDGQLVASSFSDLTSGSIHNAINIDEHGSSVATSWVWTQTSTDGTKSFTAAGCLDFGTNQSGSVMSNIGSTSHSDGGWSFQSQETCDYSQARLYCFQQ